MKRISVCTPLMFLFLLFLFPSFLFADVVVHDGIGVWGQPVTLKAATGSGFFKKGGELVEFFLDGRSIGKNLSGGDGLAYKEIVAAKTGLIEIGAESRGEKGKGLLLVLKKGTGIVCIDAEAILSVAQISLKPKEGSKEAVGRIASRFPMVYLQTGIFGTGIIKTWLHENGFERVPLIPWNDGQIFEEIRNMGLKVMAVVGSRSVIESAHDYTPVSFTFESGDDTRSVENWEEIERRLK